MATFIVDTTADTVDPDDGRLSLREALTLAQGGGADRITFEGGRFADGGGRIVLSESPLAITQAGGRVTIDGDLDDDGRPDVTVDANGGYRAFTIEGSTDARVKATLDGLRVTGSGAAYEYSSAIVVRNADLAIESSAITRNFDGGFGAASGAGLDIAQDSNVTITNSRISGNRSSATYGAEGGAISIDGGSLTIADCIVADNSARADRIEENAAGGAISAIRATVSISSSVFSSNEAYGFGGRGGAIAISNGRLAIAGSTFAGNDAGGASLYVYTGAGLGGAIWAFGSPVSIVNSSLVDNKAEGLGAASGGAVFARAGRLVIANTTISGNQALLGANASDDRIYGEDGGLGGGVYFARGTGRIVNSTIAFNTAQDLVDVSASSGGGIHVAEGAAMTIANSIVAGNSSNNVGRDIGGGAIGSNGANLFSQAEIDGAAATDIVVARGRVATDVLLPLAGNGGPTPSHAARPGSPIIDAGIDADALGADGGPLATDQRGQPRIRGAAVDIGAVESGGPGSTPVAVADAVATALARPVLIDPLGNDRDADGAPSLVGLAGTVSGGVALLTGEGTVMFLPNLGVGGSGRFRYDVVDEAGNADRGTVTVAVSAPPVPARAGSNAADSLAGRQGDDTLFGRRGDDVLLGRDGDDVLLGGLGADRLDGGRGDDLLDGGLGQNRIAGGGGADLFVLEIGGRQDIADFEAAGGDRLVIVSPELFDGDGRLLDSRLLVSRAGLDLTVRADRDGDGTFEATLAALAGVPRLDLSDLLLNAVA